MIPFAFSDDDRVFLFEGVLRAKSSFGGPEGGAALVVYTIGSVVAVLAVVPHVAARVLDGVSSERLVEVREGVIRSRFEGGFISDKSDSKVVGAAFFAEIEGDAETCSDGPSTVPWEVEASRGGDGNLNLCRLGGSKDGYPTPAWAPSRPYSEDD